MLLSASAVSDNCSDSHNLFTVTVREGQTHCAVSKMYSSRSTVMMMIDDDDVHTTKT